MNREDQSPFPEWTRGVHNDPNSTLMIGSRVVWLDEHDAPQYGSVKWIGHVPTHPKELTVGIEFDRPIGRGDGVHAGYRLFRAKKRHASLVPLDGLLPESLMPESRVSALVSPSATISSSTAASGTDDSSCGGGVVSPSPKETVFVNHQHHNACGDRRTVDRWRRYKRIGAADRSALTSISLSPPAPDPSTLPAYNTHNGQASSDTTTSSQPTTTPRSSAASTKTRHHHGEAATTPSLVDMCAAGPSRTRHNTSHFASPTTSWYIASAEACCISAGSWPLEARPRDDRTTLAAAAAAAEAELESFDAPDIHGLIPPLSEARSAEMIGKNRGIQAVDPTATVEATLFSMFAFTGVFEATLLAHANPETATSLVQRKLRESIVNPLRQRHFVESTKSDEFARLLAPLASKAGIDISLATPGEVIGFLCCILPPPHADKPPLQFDNAEACHVFNITRLQQHGNCHPHGVTAQELFEAEMWNRGVRLKSQPPYLVLQLPPVAEGTPTPPWSTHPHNIVPSTTLDITDYLTDTLRECCVCRELADVECADCVEECHSHGGSSSGGVPLSHATLCSPCSLRLHAQGKSTPHHRIQRIVYSDETRTFHRQQVGLLGRSREIIFRECLSLFAVIAAKDDRHVAFVRCGQHASAPWVYFDAHINPAAPGCCEVVTMPHVRALMAAVASPIPDQLEQQCHCQASFSLVLRSATTLLYCSRDSALRDSDATGSEISDVLDASLSPPDGFV